MQISHLHLIPQRTFDGSLVSFPLLGLESYSKKGKKCLLKIYILCILIVHMQNRKLIYPFLFFLKFFRGII